MFASSSESSSSSNSVASWHPSFLSYLQIHLAQLMKVLKKKVLKS